MSPSTPTKRTPVKQPPRNKIESSPNNRAKCHKCRSKIHKGEVRYGIKEVNEYGTTQRYYHPDCCPQYLKNKLPSSFEQNQDNQKIRIIHHRAELYNNLRELRSCFAQELEVEHYRIFQNKSLDDLVINMPTTVAELMNCWGIKEKKVESFGDAILQIIKQYKATNQSTAQRATESGGGAAAKSQTKTATKTKGRSGREDVAVSQMLTCEEIVRQKFQQAREHGYVISVE